MKIINDIKLDFDNVLLVPKRSNISSRNDINLLRTFEFKNNKKLTCVPIIASNMDTIGTIDMFLTLSKYKILTCFHKYINVDDIINTFKKKKLTKEYSDLFILSTGLNIDKLEIDIEKLEKKNIIVKSICLDVANAHIEICENVLKKLVNKYDDKIIIVGNVASSNCTENYILQGADIVKVGIGSGAVCTTRLKTGVGFPQLSANMECSDAAHGVKGRIISDGGCKTPGDICKAFASGADFVMVGSMLSGFDQSGGDIIEENNVKYKIFYGMSSKKSNDKNCGGLKNYRTSEGRVVKIKYKGDVNNMIQDILGGLRSSCSYIGARNIKNMSKCATFIQVYKQLQTRLEKYQIEDL
tara:strand:+ start:15263 stop:16327 length:1065 start_codon:yes stop_codon:yes gene_type:complete